MLQRRLAINAIEDSYVEGMTEGELKKAAESRIKEEYGSSIVVTALMLLLPELVSWFISLIKKRIDNESVMDTKPPEEATQEPAAKTRRSKRSKGSQRTG